MAKVQFTLRANLKSIERKEFSILRGTRAVGDRKEINSSDQIPFEQIMQVCIYVGLCGCMYVCINVTNYVYM